MFNPFIASRFFSFFRQNKDNKSISIKQSENLINSGISEVLIKNKPFCSTILLIKLIPLLESLDWEVYQRIILKIFNNSQRGEHVYFHKISLSSYLIQYLQDCGIKSCDTMNGSLCFELSDIEGVLKLKYSTLKSRSHGNK